MNRQQHKPGPLVSEMILGSILSLLVILGLFQEWSLPRMVEHAAYDLRALRWDGGQVTDKLVIVGVDQESLDHVGRWPWPRGYVGQLLELLHRHRAKVIGIVFPLSEPDHPLGVQELQALEKKVTAQATALARVKELRAIRKNLKAQTGDLSASAKPRSSAKDPELRFLEEVYGTILRDLHHAQSGLDQDGRFAQALARTPEVLLPVALDLSPLPGEEFPELFGATLANTAKGPVAPGSGTPIAPVADLHPPLAKFLLEGVALGHIHIQPDEDGVVRDDLLLVQYRRHLFPSMALRALSLYLNLPPGEIDVLPGKEVVMGELHIPTDASLRLPIRFNNRTDSFKIVPAYQVLTGKVGEETFRDKLVLIGPVAKGIAPRYPTPVGSTLSGAEIVASSLQTLLTQRFLSPPLWVPIAERVMLLGAAAFLILLLPRLRLGPGGLQVALIVAAYLAVAGYVLVSRGYVMAVLPPTVLLGLGFLTVAAKRTMVARIRGGVEPKPGSEAVSLGKPAQAPDRSPLPSQMIGKDGTVVMDSGALRRTLGRYEIVRELGRGAMGVVYLCRDPNINRFVAIKTLRLDEVEPDQLEQVKARFFREAQSAGKLSHPNIVTIYDAGEEGPLGYIVMEVVDGVDLKASRKKEVLLPVSRVLEILVKVAEALDYAHRQGIVHRDIKPSNIMVMKDGTVKVTDFGIARIITGSRTDTGVVLGTPNYMSPEQLTGAKVDGRSDIFSLGVVLFELLTGAHPFDAEDVTTLMYHIANQPHRPPRDARPDMPACCVPIIDRALHKDAASRYQRALEMAQALQACLGDQSWIRDEGSEEYADSRRHQN